jgi:prepilin-type N-terminal cleavage/methylation domain-containing protein
MRPEIKTENAPRGNSVAVDWHDCAWSPPITVQTPPNFCRVTKPLPAPPSILHAARRHPACLKTMKTILPSSRRHRAGFTLVEMLVVIAIIGILAALLLPVFASVVMHAKMAKAKTEAESIATAVEGYDSAYGRFPVSTAAQTAAGTGDFTYGGTGHDAGGNVTWTVGTAGGPTNNAEVIAILMDMQTYPDGVTHTINYGYVKNPQQRIFLNAHMSGDASSSGVGTDLVYRDPWGNPYVITMDLNYDELCEDVFYKSNTVSAGGLNGLIQQPDGFYAAHTKVMVWSAGPDGKIDGNSPANLGANKDNVLGWQ